MSFAKAKRFNYKEPELRPSPADYFITTSLERGSKISKSQRFNKPAKDEETSSPCSQTSSRCCSLRSSTPKSEEEYNTEYDLNSLKRKIVELNRNDIKRQSIRRKRFETNEKPKTSNSNSLKYDNNRNDIKRQSLRKKPSEINEKPKVSNSISFEYSNADKVFEQFCLPRRATLLDHDYCRFKRESFDGSVRSNASSSNSFQSNDNVDQNVYFHVHEEFIDDDDFTDFTNSEKVDYEKPVEGYAIEQLYSDFGRMQLGTKERNNINTPAMRGLLENIDNKVKTVSDDLAKLHECLDVKETRKKDSEKYLRKTCVPGSSKYEEINSIIKRTMKFLRHQFEMYGKCLRKDTEARIRGLFTDIFVTSEKSTEQIQECCYNTANHLSRRINRTLNITSPSAMESNSVNDNFAIEGLVTQNDEDYDDEDDDDLDFTLKFGDTEERLELQESIMDALKQDLVDLKESFCKIK